MVLTVTPNPSLDLLFETDELVWDDANRMADPRRRVGGQGINVTRAVRALGGESAALAVLGGRTGEEIAALLAEEGTPLVHVAAEGETRTFVAVRERGTGRSLLLNARGPARGPESAAALLAATVEALARTRPRWLACCGSVPPGFPLDFYATVAALARETGCRVVVDCDGVALRRAAPACDLLVPNEHEAQRLTGQPVADAAQAAAVARRLVRAGTPHVAITLGPRGAVYAAADGCWAASTPPLHGGSAVGAGDAFLAALLLALDAGLEPPERLRAAVAAGAAVLLSEGGALIDRRDAESLRAGISVAPVPRDG